MLTLLLALIGFALLDSPNILVIGLTTAIVADSRLQRRSPVPGGANFLLGVYLVTTAFGLCTVLGLNFLTGLVDFELTPTIRYWGELILGTVLIPLAFLPLHARGEPPPWAMAFRTRPWLLILVGAGIGLGQAPTAVPYLAGLAMLSAQNPLPPLWPAIVLAYCAITLLAPTLILALSTRKTLRARRFYRGLVRALTTYGPPAVRILFAGFGIALVADAAIHYSALF
ncbi:MULTISPECIES: GAP family protein [Nocardia]|uniref:GAP family protein n=1 Tax=Nocardia arthritidis TaxID=228602 RepID=A0A6G9YRD9_9NOCA|nr:MULTISPECIES: GAP family protein [Nocardia]QIS15768.1 hypothetical protein F5544_39750 [Nocardia arthritidis]